MSDRIHEDHFADGVVSSHYRLIEGSKFPHGHAFWNFPSGQRRIDGCYTNGIRSGPWTEFELDGSIRSVFDFGQGEYVKPKTIPKLEDVVLNPETTILLEEEFGYRLWFWIPGRPIAELIEWWRGLFSVEPWCVTPEPLPGILIHGMPSEQWNELYATRQFIWGHINDDDDSELRLPSGEAIYHQGRVLALNLSSNTSAKQSNANKSF